VFAASPKGRAFLRRQSIKLPWWFDIRAEHRTFAKYAPTLWQEITGIADGLGISMERAVLCFGNDGLRPPIGACSAVVSSHVYGRNYDFRPRHYEARLVLLQATGSYASIGASALLTGRLDGMNERGLAIGLHLVRASPRSFGLSCVLITRIVLDQCATTEEAVAILRRIPDAMQYNYSVLDGNGVGAVVEAVPGSAAVRMGPWLACTNHFQSRILRPLNRRASHSQQRLPALEAWASRALSAEEMFLALNCSTSQHFTMGICEEQGLFTQSSRSLLRTVS
jgi:predicted choloylglycine hydrolase